MFSFNENLIYLVVISYGVCLIMMVIFRKYRDKQSYIIKNTTIKKIECINVLLHKIDNEENYHQKLYKVGKIFYLYKELLLSIDNNLSEEIIKRSIHQDLKSFYNEFFYNYISQYNNGERFTIIEKFLSKWGSK